MEHLIYYLAIALFSILTVLTLGMGLYGLIKGGKLSGDFANNMMRKRILFQFLAVVVAMFFLYVIGKGPI